MSQTDGSSSTGQTCKMPEGDPSPATQGPVQEPLLMQNPSYHHQPDAVVHQPPPLLLPPPPPMMFAPQPVMSSSNNNTTQQVTCAVAVCEQGFNELALTARVRVESMTA